MQSKMCYNRIVGKYVRNKYKYYVQIVFKGSPPVKVDTETGEIKHYIGGGDVGIDIGTRTIAISSQFDVKMLELADRVQNIENFYRLHNLEVDRLTGKKNLSSIAI